jgi:malonate-semialdehyde dehydrogenase (acetylating)/methylmalonate-semialdehyde dehydrogenase
VSVLNEPIKEVLELKNYIGGKWVKSTSGKTLDVKNPATQKTIAKVPMSSPDEVNAAVAAAKEAFPEWRRTPPLVRARYLFKLRELLEENF